MARENKKTQIVDYENSIKKSNELSMAKLSHGLTLNQMQLLAYAIYCTQQDGKTEFIKADFEKKFGIEKYQTAHAKEDAQKLLGLQFSIEDLENDYFAYWNVFGSIRYKEGLFNFKWNEEFIPHILQLKEKYVMTDLTITANFKSSFSWILYDYLRALYGYWFKSFTKDELMKLFNVENRKTYRNHTGLFKKYVLDVAIKEINEHTELEVSYKEQKQGRKIIGFNIYWSSGKKVFGATRQQIEQLKAIIDKSFDYYPTLADFKDNHSKQIAINNLREIQAMEIHIQEPIAITSNYANQLIQLANDYLRMIDQMYEKEKNERDRSVYYNWLKNN